MNSLFHRNSYKAAGGLSTNDHSNNATVSRRVPPPPVSPAATEYHDTMDEPHVMLHEASPMYEEKQPSFPVPTHYTDNNSTKQQTTTARDYAPTTSRRSVGSHPSSVDENTVLGFGRQEADVKRSGTWARGPGTSGINESLSPSTGTGNHPSRHLSLSERASAAAQQIGPERGAILTKAETKDAKRLSKIIKAEGKSEDRQLKSSLKELSSLQSAQRKASAAETAATHAQVKAAKEEQRASAAYLEAKTRYERAIANLKVCEERLVLTRKNATKTTDMVRRQAEDVDAMRERKATDDREREVKLATLKAGLLPQ